MEEKGDVVELPANRKTTKRAKPKTLSKRKIRALDHYLSSLEFLRRVLVEDLNAKEGSAAEIRSNGDPDSMQEELHQVTRWQLVVDDGDELDTGFTEKVVVMAKKLRPDLLFRSFKGAMGYPDIAYLHRQYMHVIHGQPMHVIHGQPKGEN